MQMMGTCDQTGPPDNLPDFMDQVVHSAERFTAPVPEFSDSLGNKIPCRLAAIRPDVFVFAPKVIFARLRPSASDVMPKRQS